MFEEARMTDIYMHNKEKAHRLKNNIIYWSNNNSLEVINKRKELEEMLMKEEKIINSGK